MAANLKRIYPQEPLLFYIDKDKIKTFFYDKQIIYCNNENKHQNAENNNYLVNYITSEKIKPKDFMESLNMLVIEDNAELAPFDPCIGPIGPDIPSPGLFGAKSRGSDEPVVFGAPINAPSIRPIDDIIPNSNLNIFANLPVKYHIDYHMPVTWDASDPGSTLNEYKMTDAKMDSILRTDSQLLDIRDFANIPNDDEQTRYMAKNIIFQLYEKGIYDNPVVHHWYESIETHFPIVSLCVYLYILVIVLLGTVIPAWRICRSEITESLREE